MIKQDLVLLAIPTNTTPKISIIKNKNYEDRHPSNTFFTSDHLSRSFPRAITLASQPSHAHCLYSRSCTGILHMANTGNQNSSSELQRSVGGGHTHLHYFWCNFIIEHSGTKRSNKHDPPGIFRHHSRQKNSGNYYCLVIWFVY